MSGQSPPPGAEIVHECERTRVTRVVLPERTVVRKQPLGPGAERRLVQIQRRFRVLDKKARHKAASDLARLGVGVFLAVVAIGLASSFGLPLLQASLAGMGLDQVH